MATLNFDHIFKQYHPGGKQETTAVNDFSLKVESGELIVVLGPSGCGKTTLLRLISGLDPVSAGEILINGRSVHQIPAYERPVSMVFQNYALYPHMTAEQNLTYALRIKKVPRDRITRRLQHFSNMLRLDKTLLKRKPAMLSGGQRQRVALGRALIQQPKVVLLDEPFSNLDQNLKHRLRNQVRQIQKDLNITMILVTHDQNDAMTMGDRIVLMRKGKIVQAAPPEQLYYNPDHLFAAKFMGWPQINQIQGQIHEQKGRVHFIFSDQSIKLELKPDVQTPVKSAILCVRPEHVKVSTQTDPGRYDLMGEEYAGGTRYLYARLHSHQITGQPSAFSHGGSDRYCVSFPADSALFYDPVTQAQLPFLFKQKNIVI